MLAHVSLVAGAVFGGVVVPARVWDVFAAEVLLATVWAFGRETVITVSELWPGGMWAAYPLQ